jgi:hypothetical protein
LCPMMRLFGDKIGILGRADGAVTP